MQDFYILQRTPTALDSEQAKKWFYTVEMLGPGGIMAGDDDTTNLMLGMQDRQYVYILPLIRHLTSDEAERIVEGYMRVTDHDFEVESSNVYRADAQVFRAKSLCSQYANRNRQSEARAHLAKFPIA